MHGFFQSLEMTGTTYGSPVMVLPSGRSGTVVVSDLEGAVARLYQNGAMSLSNNPESVVLNLATGTLRATAVSLTAAGDKGRTCDEVPVSTSDATPLINNITNRTVSEIAQGFCGKVGATVTLSEALETGRMNAPKNLYTMNTDGNMPEGIWGMTTYPNIGIDLQAVGAVMGTWAGLVLVGELSDYDDEKYIAYPTSYNTWMDAGHDAGKKLEKLHRKNRSPEEIELDEAIEQ